MVDTSRSLDLGISRDTVSLVFRLLQPAKVPKVPPLKSNRCSGEYYMPIEETARAASTAAILPFICWGDRLGAVAHQPTHIYASLHFARINDLPDQPAPHMAGNWDCMVSRMYP